jgi:hypothetical protein
MPPASGAWRAPCSSRSNAMLARVTALCLAVLVLSPFTAPFPTCDLAMLLGRAPMQDVQHVPANRPAQTTIAVDGNVASVPAISRVGRPRLLDVSHLNLPGTSLNTRAAVIRTGVSSPVHGHAVFATILRV